MFDAPMSKRKHPDSAAAAEQVFGTLPCTVGLDPIGPRRSGGTLRNSFISKEALHVSFAVQNTNNVHGVCLQSVMNPNGFKSSNRP
jgi:hypothetical protein